jgi:hypothetical protein
MRGISRACRRGGRLVRKWPFSDSRVTPNGRFAPEAVAPAKFVYDPKPRCPAMRRIGVLISFRKSDHEAGSLVAEFREEDCRDARLVDLPER